MTQTEERARGSTRGRPASEPATNGRDHEDAVAARRPYALRKVILPALGIALLLAIVLGVWYFTEQASFVSTDNATISGTVSQLGVPGGGQVRTVVVDVGATVERNQTLATIGGLSGQVVALRAPHDGVVVARYANPGDVLAPGRSIFALLDPNDVWVQAQIDETVVGRIHPGQRADVTVDALGATVAGRVQSVGRASVGATSASGAGQTGGLRGRPMVPVRIFLDEPRELVYGGQASIRIYV